MSTSIPNLDREDQVWPSHISSSFPSAPSVRAQKVWGMQCPTTCSRHGFKARDISLQVLPGLGVFSPSLKCLLILLCPLKPLPAWEQRCKGCEFEGKVFTWVPATLTAEENEYTLNVWIPLAREEGLFFQSTWSQGSIFFKKSVVQLRIIIFKKRW